MSDNWVSPQEPSRIVTYQGTPKDKTRSGERTHWRRFCEWLLPWMRRKRELGDDYLEAKVLNEYADVIKKMAEAKQTIANANKTDAQTAEIANRLDAEKASIIRQSLREQPVSELIEQHLHELEDKMKTARLLHGTRIIQLEQRPTELQE